MTGESKTKRSEGAYATTKTPLAPCPRCGWPTRARCVPAHQEREAWCAYCSDTVDALAAERARIARWKDVTPVDLEAAASALEVEPKGEAWGAQGKVCARCRAPFVFHVRRGDDGRPKPVGVNDPLRCGGCVTVVALLVQFGSRKALVERVRAESGKEEGEAF